MPRKSASAPRPVSAIDVHPHKDAIIQAILARESQRSIARRFNVSQACVSRFIRGPLKRIMLGINAANNKDVSYNTNKELQQVKRDSMAMSSAISTAALVERKMARYEPMMEKAAQMGDLKAWSSIDRSETAALQLRADLLGERAATQAANIQVAILIPSPGAAESDEDDGEVIDAAAQ